MEHQHQEQPQQEQEQTQPLKEQLLVLFASYGQFPDEYKLAGYERGLIGLNLTADEAYDLTQHYIDHRPDDGKLPAASEMRTMAEYQRKKKAEPELKPARRECQLCEGCGYMYLLEETRKPVPLNEFRFGGKAYQKPYRAKPCDCRTPKDATS